VIKFLVGNPAWNGYQHYAPVRVTLGGERVVMEAYTADRAWEFQVKSKQLDL
jgi:hypothetical protein